MNTIVVNPGTSFASQLTTVNTIYVLSGIYNLAGGSAVVPSGSILKFLESSIVTGGMLQLSSGCTLRFEEDSKITNCLLMLNNTRFEGFKHRISSSVGGTQYELDTDYFDFTGNSKTAIMQSIINTATVIQLHGRFENVFNNITIQNGDELAQNHVEKPKVINGNGATIVNTFTDSTIAAIKIKTDDLIKITDINFEINAGYAIYKDTNVRQGNTRLSFIIDRCRFRRTAASNSGLIRLINSREGNITNCMFKSDIVFGGLGIDRSNAINTNVIGCMFSDLRYGIYAKGEHDTSDGPIDKYTSYACGLNVQSAVMLGCEYGIYIEGNDSFFLNNSMIDFCIYPLVIFSQDGANITNNYFSAKAYDTDELNNIGPYSYTAVITVRNINNLTEGFSTEQNKRIILSGNTIYGHRNYYCYGIDMDVDSIDCTIQGNTLDYFVGHGIILRNRDHHAADTGWSTEKLVIDNNRFHFAGSNMDAICIDGDIGVRPVIITNNYVMEGNGTTFITTNNPYFGVLTYAQNHDYLTGTPSGSDAIQAFDGSRRDNTRIKINLSMNPLDNTLEIVNPMRGDANLVVYVANNTAPVYVKSISGTKIEFGKATTSTPVTFTAIIEHFYNM